LGQISVSISTAGDRREMREEAARATRRVPRQPGLEVAGAKELPAGGAAGSGAVRQQQAQAGPGLAQGGDQGRCRARLAERDRMDPKRAWRHGVAVAADALADRGRVERLGAAPPQHAQQVKRQSDPQQQ
jgi:hypothetical protein